LLCRLALIYKYHWVIDTQQAAYNKCMFSLLLCGLFIYIFNFSLFSPFIYFFIISLLHLHAPYRCLMSSFRWKEIYSYNFVSRSWRYSSTFRTEICAYERATFIVLVYFPIFLKNHLFFIIRRFRLWICVYRARLLNLNKRLI
jgi:hypothetical protein